MGSFGAGTYLGAAASGVIAVATGRVFTPGNPWVEALPGLMMLGAMVTAFFARLTRRWLLSRLRRRRALGGGVAGMLLMPLAVGTADLGELSGLGLALMLIGALTTAALCLRWFRKSQRVVRAR
jgi:hypothetical protein